MKLIAVDRKCSLKVVSLYLTVKEAKQLRDELERLLKEPEAKEHLHIYEEDMSREISCSIITENKLKNLSGYNKLERQVLSGK